MVYIHIRPHDYSLQLHRQSGNESLSLYDFPSRNNLQIQSYKQHKMESRKMLNLLSICTVF